MSDPVTNVEIEDVLSSIRRLVSDKAAPADQPKTEEPKSEDRLVLTPALRVQQEPAPETPPSQEAEAQDEPEDDISDLSPAELEEAATFVAPTPLLLTPQENDDIPRIHDNMSDTDRASLESKIAELEAAVGAAVDDEWEPDGSESSPQSDLSQMFDSHRAAELSDDIVESGEPREEDAFAAIAAAEEANAPIFQPEPEDDPEPQVDIQAEYEEDVQAETVEPSPVPEFRHAAVDAPGTDHGDELREDGLPIPDDLDETIAAYIAGGSALKHDEMRQMIVDVVRDELRGELGERITRNVRKMVRREVLRALQTNGID